MGTWRCDTSKPGGQPVCSEVRNAPDGAACGGQCSTCRAGRCVAPTPPPQPTATVTLSGHRLVERSRTLETCAAPIASVDLDEVRISRPKCKPGHSPPNRRCRRGSRYASVPQHITVPLGGENRAFTGPCYAHTRGPGSGWNKGHKLYITNGPSRSTERTCVYWAGSHSHTVKMCSKATERYTNEVGADRQLARGKKHGEAITYKLPSAPAGDLTLRVQWSDGQMGEEVEWGGSGQVLRRTGSKDNAMTYTLHRPPPPLCP